MIFGTRHDTQPNGAAVPSATANEQMQAKRQTPKKGWSARINGE